MTTATAPKVIASCTEHVVRVNLPAHPDRPNSVIVPDPKALERLDVLAGVVRVEEAYLVGDLIVIVECSANRLPSRIEAIEAIVQHAVQITFAAKS